MLFLYQHTDTCRQLCHKTCNFSRRPFFSPTRARKWSIYIVLFNLMALISVNDPKKLKEIHWDSHDVVRWRPIFVIFSYLIRQTQTPSITAVFACSRAAIAPHKSSALGPLPRCWLGFLYPFPDYVSRWHTSLSGSHFLTPNIKLLSSVTTIDYRSYLTLF